MSPCEGLNSEKSIIQAEDVRTMPPSTTLPGIEDLVQPEAASGGHGEGVGMGDDGRPEETAADTAAYEQAMDIYRDLVAAINTRLDRETDESQAAHLHAEARRYVREEQQLRPTDRAAVDRVLTEYPAIVRQQRATASE